MKKYFISFFAAMSIICSCNSFSTKAATPDVKTTSYTEYYDDGSYTVITITEYILASTTSVKQGSKTYNHVSSGNTVWSYTINGTFSYDGSSSSCTSVSDSYTINNNSWHLNSHYCWKSGNTAYGSVTMDYKILGITTNSVTRDISLSCSANGTLS